MDITIEDTVWYNVQYNTVPNRDFLAILQIQKVSQVRFGKSIELFSIEIDRYRAIIGLL